MPTDEEVLEMLEAGMIYAECDHCGNVQEVEPDADYLCPKCKIGRLVSPLVERGLI